MAGLMRPLRTVAILLAVPFVFLWLLWLDRRTRDYPYGD